MTLEKPGVNSNSGINFLMDESLVKLFDISEAYETLYHNNLKSKFEDENILIIICSEILKNNHDTDFIESVINNSLQNNILSGVDLNKVVSYNGSEINIFLEIIKYGNLELFKKISNKVRFLKFLDIGLINSFSLFDKGNKNLEKNKSEIFEHLMFYGLDEYIDERKIIFFLKEGNIGILENIYLYDSKKEDKNRFFNYNFLKNVFSGNINNKEIEKIISSNKVVENFLTQKYYNHRIINAVDNTYSYDNNEVQNAINAANLVIKDKIIDIVTSKENIIELAKFILDKKFNIISEKVGEKLAGEYMNMLMKSDDVLKDFSDSLLNVLINEKPEEIMKILIDNIKNKKD